MRRCHEMAAKRELRKVRRVENVVSTSSDASSARTECEERRCKSTITNAAGTRRAEGRDMPRACYLNRLVIEASTEGSATAIVLICE